jgi:hypothetical protein
VQNDRARATRRALPQKLAAGQIDGSALPGSPAHGCGRSGPNVAGMGRRRGRAEGRWQVVSHDRSTRARTGDLPLLALRTRAVRAQRWKRRSHTARCSATCYTSGRAREISQRELRNNRGEIMRCLDEGESFVVTRNGMPSGSRPLCAGIVSCAPTRPSPSSATLPLSIWPDCATTSIGSPPRSRPPVPKQPARAARGASDRPGAFTSRPTMTPPCACGRATRQSDEGVDCHLGHASQSTIVRIGPAKRGRAAPEAHRSSRTGCSSFMASSGSASR